VTSQKSADLNYFATEAWNYYLQKFKSFSYPFDTWTCPCV